MFFMVLRRKLAKIILAGTIALGLSEKTNANVFSMADQSIKNLEMVTVGNPGNAPDTRYQTPGYGAVPYSYNIGKYEVTAGQYCEFLNAVAQTDTYELYNPNMLSNEDGCQINRIGSPGSYKYDVASYYANRPVNYVSWGDAARFANWLTNSQPTGGQNIATTEDGSYYLNGAMSGVDLLAVTRKTNGKYVIPSEDEWYKAAYYDSNKSGGAGYWNYSTISDTAPNYEAPPGTNSINGSANFNQSGLTDVGAYTTKPSISAYGTFDQGGNVWEWNSSVVGSSRSLRGGSFNYNPGDVLHAKFRTYDLPVDEHDNIGFRISEVPEPAALGLLALGGIGFLGKRKKK